MSGELLDLRQVPNDIFSSKLMGDGFAINPIDGVVISPVNGVIRSVSNKKHLVVITSEEDRDILIHIGVDTKCLKDEDFLCYIKNGEKVIKGQKLIEYNLSFIKKKTQSIINTIIFTNLDSDEFIYFPVNNNVKLGEKIIEIHRNKK